MTHRRTRIVATIGPASHSPEALAALIRAGVDVCRINCSHATHPAIRRDVRLIRQTAARLGRDVAVLLDLQGPKIRTGPASAPITLTTDDVLTVVMDPDLQASGLRIGTTWPQMAQDVQVGEPVLFADGTLSGQVVAVRPDAVDVRILNGGLLGAHKGINLPRTQLHAPALTDKDRADLAVGIEEGVDWLALSFVRHAQDVRDLREALGDADIPIIAKIEKPQAVQAIDAILGQVQGIMVARGDLGVEIPFEQVPVVQKSLIAAANHAGVLVITATQMLDSMERSPRPTRAEANDVANAILDGTDAVMLSGETAAGLYPVLAVQTMDHIAQQVERSDWFRPPALDDLPARNTAESTVLRAACWAVRDQPRPLVVFTLSGATAIKASKSRPLQPIIAITHSLAVRRRLALAWGVQALDITPTAATDDLIPAGERAILEAGLLERGQEVVVLAGRVPMRGATNMMKVEVLDGR